MYHKNTNQRYTAVAKLTSDKVDFRKMNTIMSKEGQYIIMVSIDQEDITVLNVYALSNRTSKYLKQ